MPIARLVVLAACFASASIPASARLGHVLFGDTQAETTLVGAQELDLLGVGQAIGDLDGDGIADLLLVAWDERRPGRLLIFRGPILPGVRDLRAQPADITLVAGAVEWRLGADNNLRLADLDGDGHLDIVVGAPNEGHVGLGGTGAVHVLYGPFVPGTHAMDTLPGLVIVGAGGYLGVSAAVGDLSGDGVPDLAMGEALGGCCGRVYVLFGPLTTGFIEMAINPADYMLLGASSSGNLGDSIAIADVSGDGRPDLIVGDAADDGRLGDRLQSGAIHVIHGPLARGGVRDLGVAPADTTIHGARGGSPPLGNDGDALGLVVSAADLDLDGAIDIVSSGWTARGIGGEARSGLASVVFGPFAAPHVDLLTDPSQARIFGAEAEDALGWDILLTDVSADGVTDLVVGSFGGGVGCTDDVDPGAAHVFFGPIQRGMLVNLATNVSDLAITGTEPHARCCLSRDAGDLDGDGTTDLVFSCYHATRPDGLAARAGIVHIVSPEVPVDQLASPCCDAGAPISVACDAPRGACGVDVQLDGSASHDPQGGVLTFEWEVACGASIVRAVGPMPVVCLDAQPGTTCTATLTTTSPSGIVASCATTIAFDGGGGALALSGVPPDAVASCDALPPVPVVSAADACGGVAEVVLAERQEAGACADTYALIRRWTATDAAGNVAEAEQRIDVSDLAPPELIGVPPAILVGCGAVPAPAPVEARDACDPAPSLAMSESVVPGDCASRSILRTWTARDRCGNEVSASQEIDVRDDEPPQVFANDAELAVLWAPNHRMTCFDAASLSPSITESCSPPATWRIVDCVSDQPDDRRGDGATHDDCVVAADGQSACVRSERAGDAPAGRRYALSIVATDACGNASAPALIGVVRVQHDQRRRR